MYCTYCGKKNPENTEYCAFCGKRIGGTTPIAMTPPPISVPAVPFIERYRGWIIIIGSILILFGFILPWVSVDVMGVGGSFSGLTGFFGLLGLVFGSIFGASAIYDTSAGAAVGIVIFSLLLLIPCALILVFGILHLIAGVKVNNHDKGQSISLIGAGSALKDRSIASLVFLGIYFLLALSLSSVHVGGLLGSVLNATVGGTYLGVGFWFTTIGYIVTLVMGNKLIASGED